MSSDLCVDVLVTRDCPHAEAALDLAARVLDRLAPGVRAELARIEDPESAARASFPGSPSIRVNGLDVEGRTLPGGAMACRTYEGGAGVPPEWLVEAAVLRALKPQGVLFLCVANSARSQIAEGIARFLAPSFTTVWSAGSRPTTVRPEAKAVLEEIGIDISRHRSKAVADIPTKDVDTVVTLCAEEECPVFLGNARRVHWGLPDPAGVTGSPEDRMRAFRGTRDELRRRLEIVFAGEGA